MTDVKTIKCEIHCQNGESLHAAFPAVPGIWEREEIYVEVSENRSYGCRYGQIRLNMRQGALRKEKPIRVSLPTVQSPEKITAMYMLNDWWTRPAFVEGFQEIPARTQVAFLKYPDRFACLVPMVGKTFKTYLEAGTEQEVCLEMLSSLDGQTEVDEPLYVLGEADTLADAVHKVFAWLTKRMGVSNKGTKAYARKCSAFSAGAAGMLFTEKSQKKKSVRRPASLWKRKFLSGGC